MSKRSFGKKQIPAQLEPVIKKIGNNIEIARKRRGLSRKVLAERMLVSIPTLTRLEHGDVNISFGVLVNALWCMGIHRELSNLAAPDLDEIGKSMEISKLPERIKQKKEDNDF
ncbi:MAG: helix-turn-helix domain-containing protein [Oligoflexia bacterium]|nr:helix-turn-helix domain-containing protein [Oligoflexia bacterium]